MLNSVLTLQLREKAGSETYNRYEYQTNWIVFHMIQKFKNREPFLIICEFHDDMALCDDPNSPAEMNFFQIKTKDTGKAWSFKLLFDRTYRGGIKKQHSFLGFIFYNYLHFKGECRSCHFVSNLDFDIKTNLWQATIKNGKTLSQAEPSLYNEIKGNIRIEYPNISATEFDLVFEKFVQNTYLYNGDLPLQKHGDYLQTEFFKGIKARKIKIDVDNGFRMLNDIVSEVRNKTTTGISMPISFNDLKKKKGVSSDIFDELEDVFKDQMSMDYDELEQLLKDLKYPVMTRRVMIRRLKAHFEKRLNVLDTVYQDIIGKFEQLCYIQIDGFVADENDDLQQFETVMLPIIDETLKLAEAHDIDVNKIDLKGIMYGAILSK